MSNKKFVVFDLDETLGYFTELGVFIDALETMNGHKPIPRELFYHILDIFSFFLRPDILDILKYLKRKKENGFIVDNNHYQVKVMIYTNNNGRRKWALAIKSYFEWKLKYKLFDRIISAWKINNKQIEKCRTSHQKSYKDLLKCGRISKNSKICFIDDYMHEQMVNDKIYYIKLPPYKYKVTSDFLVNKFLKSKLGKFIHDKKEFKYFISKYIDNIMNKPSDYSSFKDTIGKKEIIEHLHYFLYKF